MTSSRDERLAELEQLYKHGFSRFFRVAWAITGDREIALEAVQEAFARAIHRRSSFRGEGPLEAWLWRIVVNTARSTRANTPAEFSDQQDAIEFPDTLPVLAPVLAQLPERQRLAIFLRYYADLDYRSIAATLGVEVGTVSATLASAHTRIRTLLGEEVRANG